LDSIPKFTAQYFLAGKFLFPHFTFFSSL
jgi:hypothetical protein